MRDFLKTSKYDFPEDWERSVLPSGRYCHICPECKKEFDGGKGRVLCKICLKNQTKEGE